jgi:hypothetical protein
MNKRLTCPVCGTNYSGDNLPSIGVLYREGDVCKDYSQGQSQPCRGRLVLATDDNEKAVVVESDS